MAFKRSRVRTPPAPLKDSLTADVSESFLLTGQSLTAELVSSAIRVPLHADAAGCPGFHGGSARWSARCEAGLSESERGSSVGPPAVPVAWTGLAFPSGRLGRASTAPATSSNRGSV